MAEKNWQFDDLLRRGLGPGQTPYWESQAEGWKAGPTVSDLTPTDGGFVVGDGTGFVVESGDTARASLGAGAAIPVAVQQDLAGAGAVTLTEYYTAWTPGGTAAGTLAAGTAVGQLKKIKSLDANDGTLTFNTDATIVFTDVGDYAVLLWDGTAWVPIELGNDADGATAPDYTPASE